MKMDNRTGRRLADWRRVDIVSNGRSSPHQHDPVFKKRTVAIVVLPIDGSENLEERTRLINIVRTETDHRGQPGRGNSAAESKFPQRPRIQGFVDRLPGPGEPGLESLHL